MLAVTINRFQEFTVKCHSVNRAAFLPCNDVLPSQLARHKNTTVLSAGLFVQHRLSADWLASINSVDVSMGLVCAWMEGLRDARITPVITTHMAELWVAQGDLALS